MHAEKIVGEIKHLPPAEQAEVARFIRMLEPGRMWTLEELGEAAQRMVDEADPARATARWQRIMAGFYGDANVQSAAGLSRCLGCDTPTP